jgi:hypothetical protein
MFKKHLAAIALLCCTCIVFAHHGAPDHAVAGEVAASEPANGASSASQLRADVRSAVQGQAKPATQAGVAPAPTLSAQERSTLRMQLSTRR